MLGIVSPDHDQKSWFDQIRYQWLRRSLSLSNLAVIALGEVLLTGLGRLSHSKEKSSLSERIYLNLGEKMIDVMSNLKGVPQKIGQLLAYMDIDMPFNVRQKFRQLQHNTPALSASRISEVFLEDFKKTPRQMFQYWNDSPVATASLGQVHCAIGHDGKKMAVKVQYPKIREAMESDLKNAEIFDRVFSLIFRAQKPRALIEEVKKLYMDECDYLLEMKSQKLFGQLFKDDPDVHVPAVYPDLCSSHILSSAYVPGMNFDEFRTTANQDEKNRVARIIWKFYWISILRHQTFSCDPHLGNFLFSPEGPVSFIDYGCIKIIPESFWKIWSAFFRCVLRQDKKGIIDHVVDMGLYPQEGSWNKDFFVDLILDWYTPCLETRYQFTSDLLKRNWNKMTLSNPNTHLQNIPPELLFLNQVQWGLWSLMVDLEASGSFNELFEELGYL
jgi:predicted unusual protein kinase regulating ubiquinone biosynthesis (AarF/ABC1/UbiB family)